MVLELEEFLHLRQAHNALLQAQVEFLNEKVGKGKKLLDKAHNDNKFLNQKLLDGNKVVDSLKNKDKKAEEKIADLQGKLSDQDTTIKRLKVSTV
jgi:uncharacterized coiled-coil protein SlyX